MFGWFCCVFKIPIDQHLSKTTVRWPDFYKVEHKPVCFWEQIILHSCGFCLYFQGRETPSKIFLINCLCTIQQPLIGHEAAAKYATSIGDMIENHMRILIDKEVETLLRRCNLLNKISSFRKTFDEEGEEATNSLPLAEVADTSPASLAESLNLFFGLILGTGNSLPEFEQLQVPKLRSEACIQLAKSLADTYQLVYNAIMDPKNSYPDPKSLARHPPDQIRTILGI